MNPFKNHRGPLRLVSLVLAMALVFTLQGMPTTVYAAKAGDEEQAQLDDLNSRYDELERQQKELQENIKKATSEKDKQLAIKKQLDNQMNLTQQQISLLNQRIALLSENIKEQEATIVAKQEEIDEKYETFKQRMRVTYMAGEASTLDLVLGAESFADFLTRAEITSRIAQRDNELMENLRSDIATIEDAKAQIDADKTQVEAAKSAQAAKQSELGGQIKNVESQIQDIKQLEADYKANKAKIDAEMVQVQSDIDKIYQGITSEGEYTGGKMTWPVPGYPNITSYYGWRFNNTDYHTGIDISGGNVFGKNIVAAADGKVIHVQTTYTPGKGYGKYLIIDHGGNISTLYGHTNEILVSVGQHVSRGQVVARVGTTGWSTGPHLHFEVRVNGKHTNPLVDWLK